MATFHNPTGNQNDDSSADDYANLAPVAGLDTSGGDFSSSSTTVPVHVTTPSNVQTDTLYLTEPGDTSAISVNDLHQGQIGDCFLISSIGELAINDPSFISNMIHVNANGTETVTLHEDANGWLPYVTTTAFKSVQITVTNQFPNYAVNNGTTQDAVGNQKEIWPAVLEKAFSQLYGGYGGIAGGGSPVYAMEALTGKVAQYNLQPASITLTSLMADVSAHDLIVMDTPNRGELPFGLYGDHAYMFEGVTGSGSSAMVHLGNPWGMDQPTAIPFMQLSRGVAEVDIGHF